MSEQYNWDNSVTDLFGVQRHVPSVSESSLRSDAKRYTTIPHDYGVELSCGTPVYRGFSKEVKKRASGDSKTQSEISSDSTDPKTKEKVELFKKKAQTMLSEKKETNPFFSKDISLEKLFEQAKKQREHKIFDSNSSILPSFSAEKNSAAKKEDVELVAYPFMKVQPTVKKKKTELFKRPNQDEDCDASELNLFAMSEARNFFRSHKVPKKPSPKSSPTRTYDPNFKPIVNPFVDIIYRDRVKNGLLDNVSEKEKMDMITKEKWDENDNDMSKIELASTHGVRLRQSAIHSPFLMKENPRNVIHNTAQRNYEIISDNMYYKYDHDPIRPHEGYVDDHVGRVTDHSNVDSIFGSTNVSFPGEPSDHGGRGKTRNYFTNSSQTRRIPKYSNQDNGLVMSTADVIVLSDSEGGSSDTTLNKKSMRYADAHLRNMRGTFSFSTVRQSHESYQSPMCFSPMPSRLNSEQLSSWSTNQTSSSKTLHNESFYRDDSLSSPSSKERYDAVDIICKMTADNSNYNTKDLLKVLSAINKLNKEDNIPHNFQKEQESPSLPASHSFTANLENLVQRKDEFVRENIVPRGISQIEIDEEIDKVVKEVREKQQSNEKRKRKNPSPNLYDDIYEDLSDKKDSVNSIALKTHKTRENVDVKSKASSSRRHSKSSEHKNKRSKRSKSPERRSSKKKDNQSHHADANKQRSSDSKKEDDIEINKNKPRNQNINTDVKKIFEEAANRVRQQPMYVQPQLGSPFLQPIVIARPPPAYRVITPTLAKQTFRDDDVVVTEIKDSASNCNSDSHSENKRRHSSNKRNIIMTDEPKVKFEKDNRNSSSRRSAKLDSRHSSSNRTRDRTRREDTKLQSSSHSKDLKSSFIFDSALKKADTRLKDDNGKRVQELANEKKKRYPDWYDGEFLALYQERKQLKQTLNKDDSDKGSKHHKDLKKKLYDLNKFMHKKAEVRKAKKRDSENLQICEKVIKDLLQKVTGK